MKSLHLILIRAHYMPILMVCRLIGGVSNFVNPPYNRKDKEAFVRKGIQEAARGKRVVLLLPVSTSTALFHDYIKPNAKEIRFVRGRVRFTGINTKGELVSDKPPMHDSMIVVL
jgi:hypothetical protein